MSVCHPRSVCIFRSPGAIAIFWPLLEQLVLYLMLTALPNYLKGMLGFNLKAAGALGLPYLGMVAMSWTGVSSRTG